MKRPNRWSSLRIPPDANKVFSIHLDGVRLMLTNEKHYRKIFPPGYKSTMLWWIQGIACRNYVTTCFLLMKNLGTTTRANSTLQTSLTKFQERYDMDTIVGRMSNLMQYMGPPRLCFISF
mmetsp:Transcript_18135/g.22292  ORF Transcript_18135/g.22292 Transcript_18135/m.22292 type:complete len:120 (-) Transcript_18135:84-443(-)